MVVGRRLWFEILLPSLKKNISPSVHSPTVDGYWIGDHTDLFLSLSHSKSTGRRVSSWETEEESTR